MRIQRIHLENYRVHRDLEVNLDASLNLVHGPNESGKSTLVEAVHRALFLKAKGTTDTHRAMESDFGGEPKVTLKFEAGNELFELEKTFGAKGKTVLSSAGKSPRTGDEAEAELATILGVEGVVGGRGAANTLPNRWAHLWVWQGSSSSSPLGGLSESEGNLRNKLQARSGTDLLSSALDAQVIEALATLCNQTYTGTGKVKSGSELHRMGESLDAARKQYEEKQAKVTELHQAADDFERATADMQRYAQSMQSAEKQLQELDGKLKSVQAMREELKDKTLAKQEAEKQLQSLEQADQDIRRLDEQLKQLQAKGEPMAKRLEAMNKESQERKAAYEAASKQRASSIEKLNKKRLEVDVWRAHLGMLKELSQVAELDKRLEKVKQLKDQQRELELKLAPLKLFTAPAIKKLRLLESQLRDAEAELKAYGLSIEVLESDAELALGDEALEAGKSYSLSKSAELHVGDGVSLRLTPGGAQNLREAEAVVGETRAKYESALQTLAVSGMEAAEENYQTRELLERDMKAVVSALKESNPEELDAGRRQAEDAVSQSRLRRDSLAKELGDIHFVEEMAEVESLLAELEASLQVVQSEYKEHEARENAFKQSMLEVETELQELQKTRDEQLTKERELSVELKVKREQSGDTEQRAGEINRLRARFEQAEAAEKAQRDALQLLGPEHLEMDQKRLSSALDRDRQHMESARERKIAAETRLQSNGLSDPEGELMEAQARCEQLEKGYQDLEARAQLRLNLLERMQGMQRQATQALAKPLEEAVRPYLQLLFGDGKIQLQWSEDGSRLEQFSIERGVMGKGNYGFDSLSHGAREQVALAFRLAVAELLAADHDGCLPVVLDDAFTNSDLERIEKIKRLLFRGSEQGLQIIVLSCHPENYGSLGGDEIGIG